LLFVTRWKRDESNHIIRDSVTHKPILQFVAIKRRDTKEWAIPGVKIEYL
jgi:ADP-ribose pyrophosphatase